MKTSVTGPNGQKQFELSLKMAAYEALDRLSLRIRPERPLAALIGDWSSGYVGVLNGREFTFRRARNIPNAWALKAFGSVNDHESGSVVTLRFGRGPGLVASCHQATEATAASSARASARQRRASLATVGCEIPSISAMERWESPS